MSTDPITWRRLRGMFDNPKRVRNVWESQFDDNIEKLQEMGRTPYDEVDFGDLWYYHHDLAYVRLQPELFAHLFPVCLMDWHHSLLANNECSHGDSEFHYGIIHGNVLEKMLTSKQRTETFDVFHDSMLYRLDRERGFTYNGMKTPAYGWMSRLNSLGLFMESLPHLWQVWWELETAGRAVCLLQYCSGLMYFDGENPLFESWNNKDGGDGPYLWEDDSNVFDRGWSERNIRFLREFLRVDQVVKTVRGAAKKLKAEPEAERAARIADDLHDRLDLIESRVSELPKILASHEEGEWSV